MVSSATALSEFVAAAKSYRQFLDDAARADVDMRQSGMGHAMKDVHAYALAKVRGEKPKRPRPEKREK